MFSKDADENDGICTASFFKSHLKTREERCTYAKENCKSEGVVDYFKIYYCGALKDETEGLVVMNQVLYFTGIGVGLLLLFRVLGTTADDYFAPTLTELCREMGLPPRFAGVTFLALASGAPDVSSTFAAIRGGNYLLSLGALSGAALFVTCIVSGAVVLVGNGAKAKGALCRDIGMLVFTAGFVLVIFWRGTMHRAQAFIFIILYFSFAAIVLAADIYHRRKVIFPAVVEGSRMMVRRLSTIGHASSKKSVDDMLGDMSAVLGGGYEEPQNENRLLQEEEDRTQRVRRGRKTSETEMTSQAALSTESETESDSEFEDEDSDWKYQNRLYKREMFKAMEGNEEEGDAIESPSLREEDLVEEGYLPLVDGAEKLKEPLSDKALILPKEFLVHFYHGSHESIHTLLHKMKHEGWKFFKEENFMSKLIIVLEVPFTIARTLTVPAVDSEMYFKPFFVASCIGLPFWALYNTCEDNDMSKVGALSFTLCSAASLLLGLGTLALAPSKHPPLVKLGTSFPFGLAVTCLVSFVLAALWINFFATELVSLISFIGSITGIDDSILGLTVIAWGNSIGDFSSNMAMAKRGLGNVSMTASFAGPVFNILVGLGFGFLFYFDKKGKGSSTPVSLEKVTAVAFLGVILNGIILLLSGVVNRFHIPRSIGYVSIGLYAIVITINCVIVIFL